MKSKLVIQSFATLLLMLSVSFAGHAQVSAYTMSETTDAYAAVSGTTSTATGDDGADNGIAIGFGFEYAGTTYTHFSISTNGYIKLGTSASVAIISGVDDYGNQGSISSANRPAICPMWDDNNLDAGTITYTTTGTAPNRVLSVSWSNTYVGGGGNAAGGQVSFRIDLYETTNEIVFTYSNPFASTNALNATIGLYDTGSYLSLTPGSPSTTSGSISYDDITAAEITYLEGKKLTFTPPVPGVTCNPITSFPYTQDFENGGNIPACWTEEAVNGGLTWSFVTGAGGGNVIDAHSGQYNALYFENQYGTTNVRKLITPPLDLTGLATGAQLRFWYANEIWGPDLDELKIYYKTSAAGAWTQIANYNSSVDIWTQEILSLPNPSSEYYIAFESVENYGYGVILDDIVIESQPSCATATIAPITNITTNSADIAWTCQGCSGPFVMEYGLAGFTPGAGATAGGGTLISNVTSPYTLAGLTSNEYYQFYIRQDCGDGTYSNNAAGSFATNVDCAAGTPLACGTPANVSLSGLGNWDITSCGFNTPGMEQLFAFNAPIAGIYTLDVTSATGDFADYFFKDASGGCDTAGWTCIIDVSEPTTFNFTIPAPGNYWILVDGETNNPTDQTFSITCPPYCEAPANLGATVTPYTADLTWDCQGCAGTFELEYQIAGFIQGNGIYEIPATSGLPIAGLTPNTDYDFYVRQDCSGTGLGLGAWAGPFTFTTASAAPANDECSSAILLTGCNGGVQSVSGTSLNATLDAVYTDCGTGGTPLTEQGVWYIYPGDNSRVTMTTCDPSGIGYDSRITVYSGSCGAFNCVAANEDMSPECNFGVFRSEVSFNAFAGTDYYIFVHGFQDSLDLSETGDFILNYSCGPLCMPMPGNDECSTAQVITPGMMISSTTACATMSIGVDNPTCESPYSSLYDVWYTFTTGSQTEYTITANAGSISSWGYAVYSGNCGSLTQIFCEFGSHTDQYTLNPNATYYVRVYTANSSFGGTFDLLVAPICSDPTNLLTTNIQQSSATLSWATGDGGNYQIAYNPGASTFNPNNTGIVVSGAAGPHVLTGLTSASTYYWYVREACGAGYTPWIDGGSFTTLSGPPPANDDICGALNLPNLNTQQAGFSTINFLSNTWGCNTISGSNANATDDGLNPSCGSTSGKGVWYKFTAPACSSNGTVPFTIRLSTHNSGTNYDSKIVLYTTSDNTCTGTITEVACNDDQVSPGCEGSNNIYASTINASALLIPGNTYYIMIDGFEAESGNFELSAQVILPALDITPNASSPTDRRNLTFTQPGAYLYTYYYRAQGALGFVSQSSTSPTWSTPVLVAGSTYEIQGMQRCTSTGSYYRTPVSVESLPAYVNCEAPALSCTSSTNTSITVSWNQQTGAYTAGGALSGYLVYYRVVGAPGYSFISNPTVTCNNGTCSYTLSNLLPSAAYDIWVAVRCSPVAQLKSQTITCNTGTVLSRPVSEEEDVFSFEADGLEYHGVRFSDNWSNFGLDLPLSGSGYIDVSSGRLTVALDENSTTDMSAAASDINMLGFDLVPNPAHQYTDMIISAVETTDLICHVTDLNGALVFSESVNSATMGSTIRIPTDGLAAGVYMVSVQSASRQITRKLVVLK